MHYKMVVQQAQRFKHRISQVHWRRMLYLSLPIDSVGDCIRYARFSLSQVFPYMDRIQGHLRESTYQEKPVYSHFFTQSDAFHWLAQKITHHWTRKIYITLKINNWKEIFSYTIVPILLSHFFISWRFLTKRLQLLRTCPFGFLSALEICPFLNPSC